MRSAGAWLHPGRETLISLPFRAVSPSKARAFLMQGPPGDESCGTISLKSQGIIPEYFASGHVPFLMDVLTHPQMLVRTTGPASPPPTRTHTTHTPHTHHTCTHTRTHAHTTHAHTHTPAHTTTLPVLARRPGVYSVVSSHTMPSAPPGPAPRAARLRADPARPQLAAEPQGRIRGRRLALAQVRSESCLSVRFRCLSAEDGCL